MTIISVPATAYSENWEYVQFFVGSSLAKLAVAFPFAWAFLGWRQQILWLVFKIAGVPFGSLLGVFLLGPLSRRRVGDAANVVAMIAMTLINWRCSCCPRAATSTSRGPGW